MSINLSLRLQTIHDMVKKNSVVADIGSDHGKLMIALYQSGTIQRGYAVENKKGPFLRLVKALKKENLEDIIVPLYSDGIKDIPSFVDTVVIAGMGGSLIVDILKKDLAKLSNVSTIIVDAHSCLPKVRQEICELGYAISDEKIIKEDNIFYEIIKFNKADLAYYSNADIEFGPILRAEKSALFKEKYSSRIMEIDNLLNNKDLPSFRIEQLNNEKARIMSLDEN